MKAVPAAAGTGGDRAVATDIAPAAGRHRAEGTQRPAERTERAAAQGRHRLARCAACPSAGPRVVTRPQTEPEPIDLLEVAGGAAMARYAAPAAGVGRCGAAHRPARAPPSPPPLTAGVAETRCSGRGLLSDQELSDPLRRFAHVFEGGGFGVGVTVTPLERRAVAG